MNSNLPESKLLPRLGPLLAALLFAFSAHSQPLPSTQCVSTALASGTGDAIAIPLLPCAQTTTVLLLNITNANSTTTPTISVNGQTPYVILNFDATALTAGELQPNQHRILTFDGFHWFILNSGGGGGGGGITSITLNTPSELTPVTGSPCSSTTCVLTITKANENANTVWAGPVSAGPAQPGFRLLGCVDMPLASGCPYDIAFTASGMPTNSMVIPSDLTRSVNCPASFTGSSAHTEAGTTGAVTVNINQITSGVRANRGTITWGASSATFAAGAFSGAGITGLANDTIELQFPSVADATFANVSATLKCSRV